MNNISKEFANLNQIEIDWNSKVKDTFEKYLSIKNLSPAFDSDWKNNGYIDDVANLFAGWAKNILPDSTNIYIQEIKNLTPLIVIDIPKNNYDNDDCVLIYGHLDKQPPMTGWDENIDPFKATYVGDKVYGRGSADDGYAIFTAVLSANYLIENNIPHSRILILIEASEESGSPHLQEHIDYLENNTSTIDDISLVICLDSGCQDYDHLWMTQSLRGLLQVNLSIKVLEKGTHSGGAGGIVPSAFHVARELLDRICKPGSGEIIIPEFYCEIPDYIHDSYVESANLLEKENPFNFSYAPGVQPLANSIGEQIIANTFKPALEIIGINGFPNIENAGNVLLPEITLGLSFRLPPKVDPQTACAALVNELNRDRPFNAQISVSVDSMAKGFLAPQPEAWLKRICVETSKKFFRNDSQVMGEGGTIPFMSMLGEKYPNAQFMVTGVLGPGSNAHGPNEFLHLPTAFKVTGCVTEILQAHGNVRK
ncbi:MAG: M20/M25/M40 family metallo-hydrolase [Acidimicrobiia bacterium]